MESQKTLSIIKPDAMKLKYSGKIIDFIEERVLKLLHKKIVLQKVKLKVFIQFIKKDHFLWIVDFMISGQF